MIRISEFIENELTDEAKSAIKHYTSGGYKVINQQADMYLAGTPRSSAFSKTGEILFDAVNKSNEVFDTLYRVEDIQGFKVVDQTVIKSPFKMGEELIWGLRSTSTSEKFISKVIFGKDKNLRFVGGNQIENRTVFRMHHTVGLDVKEISQYNQSEVIVSGKFRVINTGSISKINSVGAIIIDIEKV